MSASSGRLGLPPTLGSPDTAAALLHRCSNLEWSAAVAHYNAAQLHERLSRVEAAAALPPLPVPTPVFETQVGESAAEPMVESKVAVSDSGDAAAEEQEAELESLLDAALSAAKQAAEVFEEAPRPRDAKGSTPDASISERRGEEPIRPLGRWAVLQGLKAKPQYNGKLVRLGSHRADGRIETERPGSGQRGPKTCAVCSTFMMDARQGTRWNLMMAKLSFSVLIPKKRIGPARRAAGIYGFRNIISDEASSNAGVSLCSN